MRPAFEKTVKEYRKWLEKPRTPNRVQHQGTLLPETPPVLRLLGLPNLPITVLPRVHPKVSQDKHAVSHDVLSRLPGLILNPAYVFDSQTQPGAYVLVLDALDAQQRSVVAIVHVDKASNSLQVNQVASVYGKDDHLTRFATWAEAGDLRYARTEQSPGWVSYEGLQLPEGDTPNRGFGVLNVDDVTQFLLGGLRLQRRARGDVERGVDASRDGTLYSGDPRAHAARPTSPTRGRP